MSVEVTSPYRRGERQFALPRPSAGVLQTAPYLLLLCAVLALPLVLLITYSFRESGFLTVGPGPTLAQYRDIFEDAVTVRIVVRTLVVGLVVASIATTLSFVLAYAIRFRLPGRTGAIALGVVIVAGIASFLVRIYAWGTILGTKGLINSALEGLGVIDRPLGFLFFGTFPIVVTMVYLYLPIGALLVVSAMQGINPHDVQASRDLGAGRWRTAFRVVAPQARVGLLIAFALTAILASADYVTPQLVGGTKGQMAGALVQSFALTDGNYPAAAALALSFLVILLGALGGLALLLRLSRGPRAAFGRAIDRAAARAAPRVPAWITRRSLSRPAAVILLAYLIAPTLVVVVFSFNSGTTLGLPWQGFTLDWYPEAVQRSGFTDALGASIKIAVVSVTAGVAIGVPAAFALARATGARGLVLRGLVFLPYLIPGVLVGVAVLITATDRGIRLGTTLTILVHILVVAPVVTMVVQARISGLNPQLVDAARDLGAGRVKVLRTIILPLIFPAIVGAALIGAAYSLDEILATTFTIGSNTTMPIWLFGQARTGFTPMINALGVMMMGGTLVIFAAAAVTLRRAFLRPRGRMHISQNPVDTSEITR